ncbi:MAG: hypothetical protein ACJAV4_000147, partial [Pontimonas sp.]
FFFVTISGGLLTRLLASLAGTPLRFGSGNERFSLKKLGFRGGIPFIRIHDPRNFGEHFSTSC